MKKETKTTKKENELPKTSRKALEVVNDRCEECGGCGLVRPNFTNSPLCPVCNGLGVVNE